MKKWILLFVLVVFLGGSIPLAGKSSKLPKSYKKMIKAYGGKRTLSKISDRVMKGDINIKAYNVKGTMILYSKEPNKLKIVSEVMGMTVIQACDGEMSWMDNPMAGGKKEMPPVFAKQFKREALGNAALLHPRKYGIQYREAGKKKVDGREYVLLERIFPDGKKSVFFLDVKTHLPGKVETTTLDQTGKTVETESFLSDYREVDGIMVAHQVINFRQGTEFATMKFTEIQSNTGLKDSIFQMNPK